jgi:hypothetical protein
MRNNLLLLVSICLLMTLPVGARIIPDVPSFLRYNPGDIPTAAGYNADIQSACNYINDNVVAALNVLDGQAPGAMYTFDSLTQTMGVIPGPTNDDDVLTADSTAASGTSYQAPTALSVNLLKGDITVQGESGLTRLGVGANDTILTADATSPTGLKWLAKDLSGIYPTGSIIAWSPAAAGTTTIPAGFLLCDGSANTPNLIGRFILGTRPAGSNASAASGGYGAQLEGVGSGSKANHTHTVATTGSVTSSPPAGIGLVANGTVNNTATFTHTHTLNLNSLSTASMTSMEPSDIALCYIIKQAPTIDDGGGGGGGQVGPFAINYTSPESSLVSSTPLQANQNPYVEYDITANSGPSFNIYLPSTAGLTNGDKAVLLTVVSTPSYCDGTRPTVNVIAQPGQTINGSSSFEYLGTTNVYVDATLTVSGGNWVLSTSSPTFPCPPPG